MQLWRCFQYEDSFPILFYSRCFQINKQIYKLKTMVLRKEISKIDKWTQEGQGRNNYNSLLGIGEKSIKRKIFLKIGINWCSFCICHLLHLPPVSCLHQHLHLLHLHLHPFFNIFQSSSFSSTSLFPFSFFISPQFCKLLIMREGALLQSNKNLTSYLAVWNTRREIGSTVTVIISLAREWKKSLHYLQISSSS